MTRLLYIFIVFFITNICFGQSDSTLRSTNKIILGINTGSLITITPKFLNNPNSYTKEKELFNFSTCGTIEKGKSFFAIGPIISPHIETKYYDYHYKNIEYGQYRLNGFHLLYQFNIRPKAKIFSSFFQCQFIYLSHKNSGEIYMLIPYIGGRYLKYTSNWAFEEFFLVYGLKIKFLKNFYIAPNGGVGFIMDMEDVSFPENYSSYNYQNSNARTSLIASMILGYKFDSKK